jgi:hypothetical protein
MGQEWDPIDKIILESKQDFHEGSDYNDRLLNKLKNKSEITEQRFIGGFSLIMAGFLTIFMYTSGIQYKLINIQTRARSQIITFHQYYNNLEILKLLIGE